MEMTQQEFRERLAYILHLGLTEARNLALAADHQQLADLTDALEILPKMMNNPSDEDLEMLRFILKDYQAKYHLSYDLANRFESEAPARY